MAHDLEILSRTIYQCKMRIAQYKASLDEATRRLDVLLNEAQESSHVQEYDGHNLIVTIVRPESSSVDEDGLREELGEQVFEKLTKPKLDMAKLNEAVRMGEVDPVKIAKYVKVTKSTPYARATLVPLEDVDG